MVILITFTCCILTKNPDKNLKVAISIFY